MLLLTPVLHSIPASAEHHDKPLVTSLIFVDVRAVVLHALPNPARSLNAP